MKYRILVLIFAIYAIPPHHVFSQALQNEVIASAGEVYTLENTEISWTLGESIIESYQSGNTFISQGFHQPIFKFFEIPEQIIPVFQVSIFPNPTTRFVRIEVKDSPGFKDFELNLSDLTGNVLLSCLIFPDSQYQLDLTGYSDGLLLLKIIRISDGIPRSFKIVKTGY
jgi:hypothetical protein